MAERSLDKAIMAILAACYSSIEIRALAGTASLGSEVEILGSRQACWSEGRWAVADFREG